jgi:hypothetical protein
MHVVRFREAQSKRLHLDPGIVEAGTIGNVCLMGGSERGDGLSITTRAQPGTLFGADNTRPYVRRYAHRQDYFSGSRECIERPDAKHREVELENSGTQAQVQHGRDLRLGDTVLCRSSWCWLVSTNGLTTGRERRYDMACFL